MDERGILRVRNGLVPHDEMLLHVYDGYALLSGEYYRYLID